MKTPGFGQKAEKYFVAYLYPDLSLSQLDGVGKNLLGYLHYLLHPQGVTFEDAWNLILLKMNKVLSGLFCWTTESRVCREVGKLKFLQIRCTYIYLLLKHSKFRLYHSWYFIKDFLQFWCLERFQKISANVMSAYCWFAAILEIGAVGIMSKSVFWIYICSEILAMEISSRLLSFIFDTDVIGGYTK